MEIVLDISSLTRAIGVGAHCLAIGLSCVGLLLAWKYRNRSYATKAMIWAYSIIFPAEAALEIWHMTNAAKHVSSFEYAASGLISCALISILIFWVVNSAKWSVPMYEARRPEAESADKAIKTAVRRFGERDVRQALLDHEDSLKRKHRGWV